MIPNRSKARLRRWRVLWPPLAHALEAAPVISQPADTTPSAPPVSRRHLSRKHIAVVGLVVFIVVAAFAYSQKDAYADKAAALSRSLIGDENTARIEGWYFSVQDKLDQLKYKVFGGSTDPFGNDAAVTELPLPVSAAEEAPAPLQALAPEEPAYVPPATPVPLALPETKPLRASPAQGEGVWTTAGLPRSTPEDVLMAKTFIRPDSARPYAVVGVLLLDKRRIRLHMTGGTQDPGGDRGVRGPGRIPDADRQNLLVAWNGGFRGPHGGFGMYADGKQYRPLMNGLASIVVMKDGTMRIGEWGRDLTWNDEMVAVRQNAVLLVDNCEVSKRTNEGNNTWGYVQVNSAEFITWRSAVGLTKDGNLLVAAGNSLSADSLARALWAAGACYAMQLDINTPYVLTSVFLPQPDGSLKPVKFMDSMIDNPGRFLATQPNDFMYVTLDETNFVP